MTISYRPASSDDISAILEIENKTNQMPWTEAQFISSMEVGHFQVVLHEKNNIQGFAIYSPIVPESHLLNIAIHPTHQGKGIGRQAAATSYFQNKTMGVQVISLEVRVSNLPAIKLYEKERISQRCHSTQLLQQPTKKECFVDEFKI